MAPNGTDIGIKLCNTSAFGADGAPRKLLNIHDAQSMCEEYHWLLEVWVLAATQMSRSSIS